MSVQQLRLIRELAARYAADLTGDPLPVPESVRNENFRVPTSAGLWFVRIHKKSHTRERLQREQETIAWVGARGIPAAVPLEDLQGRTLHSLNNRFLSVYPWLDGVHVVRGEVSSEQASLLGDLHGRTHAVLRDLPHASLPVTTLEPAWDAAESIDTLGRVDDLLRYYPSLSAEQLAIQDGLRQKLSLLESGAARPSSDFDHLLRRPCHGDFHERNILLDAQARVVAVVDWELAALLPPVFEVIRALSFMDLWEPPLCAAYLGAYRQRAELLGCREGVELWWQAQLHNTWTYRERFIEGNRAVARFLEPDRLRLTALSDPAYRERLVALLEA